MKTIEKILKGGAVCIALLSVTFCAKENAGSGSGEGGKEKTPIYITDRANCFVVAPGAYVAFSPCKGNSSVNVEAASAGLVWQDNASLVSSVAVIDGKITVKLNAGEEGNAVVCALNEAKDTTWSWSLWVLNDVIKDVTVIGETENSIFMDRNIGALSADDFSPKSIGNVYQWGRKDPWASLNYEGGFKKMYNFEGEVTRGNKTLAEGTLNNIPNAVANPMTHWYQEYSSASKGNFSWLSTDYSSEAIARADTLWNNEGKKTIYDPCPAGYKVAAQNDWNKVKGYAADPSDTTKIIDPTYIVPEAISSKWAEKNVYQYSKQVQFRGAQWGPLKVMVGGEITHLLAIGTNKNVQGLQPTAEIWSATIDPQFAASKSNFRAYAVQQNASWISAELYLKMGNLNTALGLNLAHELPVRCVKETVSAE